RLEDQAAMSLEVVADDGNFLAVASTYVESIASQTADDFERHVFAGAFDKEPVVSFQRIDDNPFEACIRDEEAGAIDSLVVHDEVITELRSDHRQSIEAVSAVDSDRRIN